MLSVTSQKNVLTFTTVRSWKVQTKLPKWKPFNISTKHHSQMHSAPLHSSPWFTSWA